VVQKRDRTGARRSRIRATRRYRTHGIGRPRGLVNARYAGIADCLAGPFGPFGGDACNATLRWGRSFVLMMAWYRRCAFSGSLILLARCGANVATVPIGAGRDAPRSAFRAALAGNTALKQHQYSVLYSFTGYADGSWPRGGVIEDASGAFYGTTQLGGTSHTCVP